MAERDHRYGHPSTGLVRFDRSSEQDFLSLVGFRKGLTIESDTDKKRTSPTLTLIIRTRVHLLLSGASRRMTIGFEFVRRIVMHTVRIETLTILITRKQINDQINHRDHARV